MIPSCFPIIGIPFVPADLFSAREGAWLLQQPPALRWLFLQGEAPGRFHGQHEPDVAMESRGILSLSLPPEPENSRPQR